MNNVSPTVNWLVLLPLLIFLLVAIAISIYVRKKHINKTIDFNKEYFIGGKSLSGFVLAMTTVATYGSVSSFVGGPGQAWEFGFGWVYMAVIQVTALFLLYKLIGKKIAIIGHKIKAVTIIDIIKARFESNSLAIISAIVIVIFFVATMVAQFVGGAKIFEAVTGLDYKLGLMVFGICAVVFTAIGGFRGVAITDALCGIVMLLGLVILGAAIIISGGGFENILHTIQSNQPEMMQIDSGGKMPWQLYLSQWLLVGIFTFCLPQSMIRCLSAKNSKALDKAMLIGTIVIGFMMISATLIGVLAAGVLTEPLSNYGNSIDNIVPITIIKTLPPWLVGVAIIGPIAASISTISSLLISASSSLIKDIGNIIALEKSFNTRLSGTLTTLLLGLVVLGLALVPPDLIWKINMFAFGGLESAFAPIFILGLFSKRVNAIGAITGMVSAVISYCTCMALNIQILGLHQIIIGLIVGFGITIIVSLLAKTNSENAKVIFFPE